MKRLFKYTALILACVLSVSSSAEDRWVTYTQTDGLAGNEVRSIVITPGGHYWYGTSHGLSHFDGIGWETYLKTDGSQSQEVNSIRDMVYYETADGPELWLATDSGVLLFHPDHMTFSAAFHAEPDGLLSNQVRAAAVDSEHRCYFGTDRGVSIFDGKTWTSCQSPDYFYSNDITDIGIDSKSGWRYICTADQYVGRLNVGLDGVTAASPYDEWSGIRRPVVFTVRVQEDGRQWFGTDWGAAFHDTTATKKGWFNYGIEEGLLSDSVFALAEDLSGRIWAGTPLGAARFDGSEWTNYPVSNHSIPGPVLSIAADTDGSLWFGTTQGAVHFIESDTDASNSEIRPESVQLLSSYPNPFNQSTHIQYHLSKKARVRIEIYNTLGQKMVQLVDAVQPAGDHQILWNGTNEGRPVESGIYYCQLKTDHAQGYGLKILRLLLLK